MEQQETYRQNVGIALFNARGQVLFCKRIDDPHEASDYRWQMPQGGIEAQETPLQAAYREIKEELNLDEDRVEYLEQASQIYAYDYPAHERENPRKKSFVHRGQEQTWLAFRFLGQDNDIDVVGAPDPCFMAWRWEELSATPPCVIDFKRPIYQALITEFGQFARPL